MTVLTEFTEQTAVRNVLDRAGLQETEFDLYLEQYALMLTRKFKQTRKKIGGAKCH